MYHKRYGAVLFLLCPDLALAAGSIKDEGSRNSKIPPKRRAQGGQGALAPDRLTFHVPEIINFQAGAAELFSSFWQILTRVLQEELASAAKSTMSASLQFSV